jgi:transcriptional regulator GlxA family with amidase domain
LHILSFPKNANVIVILDTKAFNVTLAGAKSAVTSSQGLTVKLDIDWEDAHDQIDDYDVLIVIGGSTKPVLDANAEPIGLIKSYAELQTKDPSKERTLFSVCTGSLFLAAAGVLQGLSATTHPDYYTQFEILLQKAAQADSGIGSDVQEERYVVNNARFELGEDLEENPFVTIKYRGENNERQRRKSIARKGSDAFKAARRRESIIKRSNMPLGGMRVITSGGVTAGMDAALYLVAALVSIQSAQEIARTMQFNWQKGVTVEGIDV